MRKYIDADRLIRRLENRTYRAKGKFIEMINEQEAVDVVEVRHGRWEDRGSLSCRCSECGCKANRETAYCPACGAKMVEYAASCPQDANGITAMEVFEKITRTIEFCKNEGHRPHKIVVNTRLKRLLQESALHCNPLTICGVPYEFRANTHNDDGWVVECEELWPQERRKAVGGEDRAIGGEDRGK